MKVCPQLSEKMLASAQWVGILGKNSPQCHNDLGRKTLTELLNTVAEEKQLEDRGCDSKQNIEMNVFLREKKEYF